MSNDEVTIETIEAARERGRHGVRIERQSVPHRDHGEVHGHGEWRGEEHGRRLDRRFSPQAGHSGESLERELRELSEGLRALREELGELRRELRARNERR